jgi:phage terminase large subunit-like protein
LAKGEERDVVVTHATMYDNPHLPEHIKQALEEAYAGTAIGAQELYGRLVEQDENALWTRENIAANRVIVAPPLKKITVGVDPSGGAGEQGIVVDGYTADYTDGKLVKHGFTIADETVHLSPEGWGRAAVNAAVNWDADVIVVETNFGGDMAVSTITTAEEHMGIYIPVRTVHASRGKSARAARVGDGRARSLAHRG